MNHFKDLAICLLAKLYAKIFSIQNATYIKEKTEKNETLF